MTIILELKQVEPNEQTRKVLKFLEKNAKDISIVWKMQIVHTKKSKIIPMASKAIICCNEMIQK